MKVKTECAHGMFDAHKIERVTKLSTVDGGVESMVLEILCDGGNTMNLFKARGKTLDRNSAAPWDLIPTEDVWVEVDEPENS